MHFEITKCKIFLGKGLHPYNTKNPYTYIHLDRKRPEIWHFWITNRKIFLRKGALPLTCNTQIIYTYDYIRAWNHALYLTKYKCSYTRGHCLGPLSRALPLDPTKGPIGGPGPHSWVLVLRARCFSLQAFPKSWKPCIFDLLFTFFGHQGKVTKIPSAHISLTYIQVFCSPYWLFLPYQFWKKIRIYQVWFLFGMIPGVDFYSCHFGTTINKISEWWAKFKLESLLLICTYTNAKFIVICKPQTLNDGGEVSVKYRNRKKHCFLAAAILLFYR